PELDHAMSDVIVDRAEIRPLVDVPDRLPTRRPCEPQPPGVAASTRWPVALLHDPPHEKDTVPEGIEDDLGGHAREGIRHTLAKGHWAAGVKNRPGRRVVER